MADYQTIKNANADPTFFQSLLRSRVLIAFVAVSVGVIGMNAVSHSNTIVQESTMASKMNSAAVKVEHCPDLYTYCTGQPECTTTSDCPSLPSILTPYTCKKGSCYEGDFLACLLKNDGSNEYQVECN